MKYSFQLKSWLLITLVTITLSCNQQQEKSEAPETTETINPPGTAKPSPSVAVDKNKLLGDWTRTDAPYQIKISEMLEGGTMKVGYYNPKSINVGRANWMSVDGFIKIYIELSDENYPGSNYNLTYIPEQDLLAGKYYQAVERVTYDVGFARTK